MIVDVTFPTAYVTLSIVDVTFLTAYVTLLIVDVTFPIGEASIASIVKSLWITHVNA